MHHLKQVSSGGKVGRGRWFFSTPSHSSREGTPLLQLS